MNQHVNAVHEKVKSLTCTECRYEPNITLHYLARHINNEHKR